MTGFYMRATLALNGLNALLFADDSAIFSLPKEGLLEKLDLLEKYSLVWGSEVNTKKTKV